MKYSSTTVVTLLTLVSLCFADTICVPGSWTDCINEPGEANSVTYSDGQNDACLKVQIPSNVFANQKYFPNDGADYEIKIYTTTSVVVKTLGFLRTRCSFENSRDQTNGCKFDGEGDHARGYTSVSKVGHTGFEYQACFSGPPQPASKAHPIQFAIQWFVTLKAGL